MMVWGSDISLNFAFQPEEQNSIGLECWQDIKLSDIWIPCHLLQNRRQNNDQDLIMESCTRTLEKITISHNGFSVYCCKELGNKELADFSCNCNKNNFQKAECSEEAFKSTSSLQERQECAFNHSVREPETEVKALGDIVVTKDDACSYIEKGLSGILINTGLKELQKTNECVTYTYDTYSCIESKCDVDKRDQNKFGKIKVCVQDTDEIFSVKSNCKEKSSFNNNSRFSLIDEYVVPDVLNTFSVTFKKKETNKPDLPKKQSIRKAKKMQKKIGKVSLCEFLAKDEKSSSKDEENDDFYWHCMQNKSKLSDLLQLESTSEFPSLSLQENICTDSVQGILRNCLKEESATSNKPFGNLRDFYEYLDVNKSVSTESFSTNLEEQQKETAVIIIENIPIGTTTDDVEALVLGYGEIADLSLEPHKTCLKAELKINLVGDIDWMIECLNGSEPFGVADSGVVKCYRG